MILTLLRGLFLVLVSAVAALYLLSSQAGQQLSLFYFVLMLGGALGLAVLILVADLTTPNKKLSALSGVILGLIAGLVVAFAISFVVDLVGVLTAPEITQSPPLTHPPESGASPAAALMVPGAPAENPPPAPAVEPA